MHLLANPMWVNCTFYGIPCYYRKLISTRARAWHTIAILRQNWKLPFPDYYIHYKTQCLTKQSLEFRKVTIKSFFIVIIIFHLPHRRLSLPRNCIATIKSATESKHFTFSNSLQCQSGSLFHFCTKDFCFQAFFQAFGSLPIRWMWPKKSSRFY